MITIEHTWVLVLAGGEGSRLRSLTTMPGREPVPKQFCSLYGERTLLEDAMARANAITCTSRICVVVAEQHRHWWSPQLARLPADNVIVQPRNRGTGLGILYPLLQILARDPDANVVLLPSDHYVRDEFVLCQSVRTALEQLACSEDSPVLLGLEPEEPDCELGYIVPGEYDAQGGRSIHSFVEKPPLDVAERIIRHGALWNMFILVASAQGLLNLFERLYPEIVMAMQSAVASLREDTNGMHALTELYAGLPAVDFSRDILERAGSCLRLVRVPPCGWSDLGTPKRVAETLRRLDAHEWRHAIRVSSATANINLAVQHALCAGLSATEFGAMQSRF